MRAFRNTHTEEQYTERMLQVKALLDGTSYEEFCAILQRTLEEWAEAQSAPPIDRVAVAFLQDPLLMDEQKKQKAYQNMDLNVEIYYDAEQAGLTQQEIAQQIAEPALQALLGNYYGWARIRQVELSCYNMEHRLQYGTTRGQVMLEDFMVPPQPEEELKIQGIIYRYNMTEEAFRESLAGRSETLCGWITGDGESAQYLRDNGIDTVTVDFYTPWDVERENAVYQYPLPGLE